jgi:hypothetical protein
MLEEIWEAYLGKSIDCYRDFVSYIIIYLARHLSPDGLPTKPLKGEGSSSTATAIVAATNVTIGLAALPASTTSINPLKNPDDANDWWVN